MRLLLPVLILGLTACSGGESDSFPLGEATGGAASDGGDVGDGDSSGGHENADGGSDPGGTGGESDGGTGGEPASGGASGGEPSGGNASGGDATGGDGSGGDVATGGTGGSAPDEPDPCDPPEILDQWTSSGNDVNNVCGWTTETAPFGYAASSSRACDSITASSHFPTLADDDGIWQSPFISVIDPGERCSGGETFGTDRVYKTVGYYCMRATSPFDFQAQGWYNGVRLQAPPWDSSDDCEVHRGESLYETTVSELRVMMDEVGWVQIDVAEAPGGVCPLTCD